MKRRLQLLVAVTAAGIAPAAVAIAAASPAVVTGSASHISDSSALLKGTVNPNGSGTTYFFEWGLTNAYGVQGRSASAGSGGKPVSVEQSATNLIPGTTYHYRLVASNRFGTSAGVDRTFTTTGHPPPDVATGPATQVSSTGATVTGVVNPHGEQTSWSFDFGATTSYGFQTFGGSVPAGDAPVSVAFTLHNLQPGTIFHYRLLAAHGASNTTTFGADQQFMTFPARRPFAAVRASTRPRRARRRPFTLTTAGRVGHPGWIPDTYACSGNVAVRFFLGRRQIGLTFVALAPNCTFSARTVFRRLPGRGPRHRTVVLAVRTKFNGNGYLAPHLDRTQHVTLG